MKLWVCASEWIFLMVGLIKIQFSSLRWLLLFRHDEEQQQFCTFFISILFYFFLDIFLDIIKAHNNDVFEINMKDILLLHRQLQSSIMSQELIINQKKRKKNFQTQQ